MSLNDDTDDELNLFKQAVADVRPIKSVRISQQQSQKPQPIPRRVTQDERQTLRDADTDALLEKNGLNKRHLK